MIQFEDGSAIAQAGVDQLLEAKNRLCLPDMTIQLLPDFLRSAKDQFTVGDRQQICDQAILVLEQFYAHLPFKRARYAIDPVQRIRLLRSQLPGTSDREFHEQLLDAFVALRDVHTSYRLPPPFAGTVAFLPFGMQMYYDETGQRRFIVSAVLTGFQHPAFKPGAEITSWNGMPPETAAAVIAEHIPGGNPAAKLRRAIMQMTMRSLSTTPPPAEYMTFIGYRPGEQPTEGAAEQVIALRWYAGTGIAAALSQDLGTAVCEPLKEFSRVGKVLWCQQEWLAEQASTWGAQAANIAASALEHAAEHADKPLLESKLPDIFQIQHSGGGYDPARETVDPTLLRDANGKQFGYIRILSFEGNARDIADEFQRILGIMSAAAPDGIAIDVRGNAGGSIRGAERLLQMLTPGRIVPATFRFANTVGMQSVIGQLEALLENRSLTLQERLRVDGLAPFFREWFECFRDSVASGDLVSGGRTITREDEANDTGQVYYGPVALIVDAASYSATDTFAAGFQDHAIGPIIGADENTGGGGASRWLHSEELVDRLKGLITLEPPLTSLPAGASISVAMQRSGRVGPRAGEAVEDLGVSCDIRYRLTRKDVLYCSCDLVQFACGLLGKKKAYVLRLEQARADAEAMRLKVFSAGIDRLVCYLNGHPQMAMDAQGEVVCAIPLGGFAGAEETELRVEGYAWSAAEGDKSRTLQLVAAARQTVRADATQGAASAG